MSDYLGVAAGAAADAEADSLLAHASQCDACGALLAEALTSLEGTSSAEETTAIEAMAAMRPEWQRTMARELATTSTQSRAQQSRRGLYSRQPFRATRPFGIGIAVAAGLSFVSILSIGAAVYVEYRQNHSPERELAMAYSQARTLELRIPGAKYAAVAPAAHVRGFASNSEPADLLNARAGLARLLEKDPEDPHSLELSARADILAERYSSAIDVLDRLLAAGHPTAQLLTDAAAAYYQRGLDSDSQIDRSTALDDLRRADLLAPADPVVLFNEAILMEDRGQLMNAAGVWQRYLAVETDPQWASEGRRKLADLKQKLDPLKSHESRMDKMLATPDAVNALAANPVKLAAVDEELSSMRLDKLLLPAFPLQSQPTPEASGQARGSPAAPTCPASCQAARALLKSMSADLIQQHHDSWLSELILPDPNSLPASTLQSYYQALQLLAQATREDLFGVSADGLGYSLQARELFFRLRSQSNAGPALLRAAATGAERAEVEYVFALQRQEDFSGCRAYAAELAHTGEQNRIALHHPWMDALLSITEEICDDTPETRSSGKKLETAALHIAESENYPLLVSRIRLIEAGDAGDAGDTETAERLAMATLRDLESTDPPPFRIANTISLFPQYEHGSQRAGMSELSLREIVQWYQLEDLPARRAEARMNLALSEFRLNNDQEAEKQVMIAHQEGDPSAFRGTAGARFTEYEFQLAEVMLERGNQSEAQRYLSLVAPQLVHYSDNWSMRRYAAASGLLDLEKGNLDHAANTLETEILSSEGNLNRPTDRVSAVEYISQDHDLYGELAAVWLAQKRSPASVLALWERYRLRSMGSPIPACATPTLDCGEARVTETMHRLAGNILIGQIVIPDRVLIYRMDEKEIQWTQKAIRRRDLSDSGQALERAVSFPMTSIQTASRLGEKLSSVLLPPLPAALPRDASLLLESDPVFSNFGWPVLPTPSGPLGLAYALIDVPSVLTAIPAGERTTAPDQPEFSSGPSLIVGASVVADGEAPLPEALEEARDVSHYLPSPNLILGQRATPARIGEALRSATVFHFAGHAIEAPQGTELLLAQDSSPVGQSSRSGLTYPSAAPGPSPSSIDAVFLRQHRPLHLRLAVLSACSTGSTDHGRPQPLEDLVETLGALGVPEVIATRWQVDSEASVSFMNAFYQNLQNSRNVSVALAAARRVQSRENRYNNPYYWGAYYVTSNMISISRR